MTQRPRIALLFLSLMATSAFGAIQPSDFIAEEDGSVVYIDGAQGAKLHLEYTGAPLTAPVKVKVTPDDPGLRLSGATCTFRKSGDVCAPTVHLTNTHNKIYGVHQFTVTEVGGAAQAGSTGTPDTTPPVTFGVGLKEKGAPKPILWKSACVKCTDDKKDLMSSPVVLVNATSSSRLYAMRFSRDESAYPIELPPHSICYADLGIVRPETLSEYFADGIVYVRPSTLTTDYYTSELFTDITDPNNKIANGYYMTGNNNLTACSSESTGKCTSGLWASMSIGLANIGGENRVGPDPSDNINAGEVKVIYDQRWGKASFNNPGSIIYWQKSWASSTMALLQIQGSTDGSGFDVKKAAPTALQIQAAPPCSTFIQK